MHWEASALVPLAAWMVYAGLLVGTVISKPRVGQTAARGKVRRVFQWYLVAMMLWSLSAFLVLIGVGGVVGWFRVMLAAGICVSVLNFKFVQEILGWGLKWTGLTYGYGVVAAVVTMLTEGVLKSASVQGGVLSYEFGSLMVLVAGPGYGLTIYSLVLLARGYRETGDERQRNRLRYLMIGLGTVVVASLVNFTPLGRYPIDIAGNGVNALLIAYAIMRHQLLDIQVVIRKGLLYSIPTVLIGAGYFMIITLALRLVHISTGFEIFMLSLVVAVLTAILAQPLRDRLQEVIDRLFFREKYDAGRMLQRLSSAVASVLDLEKITRMILEEVTKTMHIEKGGFLLKRAESAEYELAAQLGLGERGEVKFNGSHPVVQWLGGKGERGGILRRQEIETLPQFRALWGKEKEEIDALAGELYIPLKAQGELVGIFVVGAKRSGQGYSLDDETTLATLANQTAIAIENARWYQEAKRLAMTDALTSLSNRRRLYELGEAEIKRARQTKQPLMIMMFDVDNFKRTNDQYGHAVGDQVLQMVSRRYLTALRGVDVFARYGGDEFVIIPAITGDDEATQLAQCLCELIKKEPVTTDAGLLTVTISMGLTGYISVNSGGEALASPSLTFDKLLHQADMAMYTAKREGGDRVCVFPLIIDEGIK